MKFWPFGKKNEAPSESSPPARPEPHLAAEALLSLRRHRREIEEVLREYPVMCTMPGLSRMLTSVADVDALVAELERLSAPQEPTTPHQND